VQRASRAAESETSELQVRSTRVRCTAQWASGAATSATTKAAQRDGERGGGRAAQNDGQMPTRCAL